MYNIKFRVKTFEKVMSTNKGGQEKYSKWQQKESNGGGSMRTLYFTRFSIGIFVFWG